MKENMNMEEFRRTSSPRQTGKDGVMTPLIKQVLKVHWKVSWTITSQKADKPAVIGAMAQPEKISKSYWGLLRS
jgi:hypothetical protein